MGNAADKELAGVRAVLVKKMVSTCDVIDPGQPAEDDNGDTLTGGSTVTVACRANFRRREYRREDGTVVVGEGTVFVPFGTVIPSNGFVRVDNTTYTIVLDYPCASYENQSFEHAVLLGPQTAGTGTKR